MSDLKNPVCLHFHIFKNAGTTIDSILEKNFSNQAVRIDIEKPAEILSMDIVLSYLKKNPRVKAFSSHQIRFPIQKNLDPYLIPILFIRHPIDRIFSIYSFNKRRMDDRTTAIHEAKIKTLEEYIEWSLKRKKNAVVRNFQVMFLSKNDNKSECNKKDLELATTRLRNCSVLGIVNRLDESLVVAEENLKKYFPKIDLSYVPKNVSEARRGTLQQKLDKERTEIKEKLWKELISKNELDLQLFSLANDELDRRINATDSFEKKLNSFQSRNKKIDLVFEDVRRKLKLPVLKNRRIWYSPNEKLFYHKKMIMGTKEILYHLDN